MKEKSLKELYSSTQAVMEANLRVGRVAYDHATTTGTVTENNWIEWMRMYLPKRYCVDRAHVIDSDNHVSDQIDLVIYDQQYSHLVFEMNGEKYVTAESVYAIFEIKQDLDKEHMDYAVNKFKSVRELKRTSAPIVSANGPAYPKKLHNIVSGILTLDSAWVSPVLKHVSPYMLNKPDDEVVDLICCVEEGSFANYGVKSEYREVLYTGKENSLIFFLLELLKKLQLVGTVPAIEIQAYEKHISYDIFRRKG